MQLTLANHPITDLQFGSPTRLEGTVLIVDPAELRRLVLTDGSIVSVDFDIVRPGEACRAGPIFDIIEPRAKEPGAGTDFPGILGAPLQRVSARPTFSAAPRYRSWPKFHPT